MSWRANLVFYSGILAVSLGAALTLGLMGYWLILPFTGLEMIGLGWALYAVSKQCHRCEVIRIGPQQITIERGWHRPAECRSLPRDWARVELQGSGRGWRPSRLLIRARGCAEEVGRFLNDDERLGLAADLKQALRDG